MKIHPRNTTGLPPRCPRRKSGPQLWLLFAVLLSLSCLLSTALAVAQEGEPTPTETPAETSTDTPTPTEIATDTPTPTEPATNTPVPTETPTDTPIPTETATDTPAPTGTATNTPVPTQAPTDTPTETATDTPTPTETATDTLPPMETPTETSTPTETPTETPVPTETPTETVVPTETLSPTLTPTATATPGLTPRLSANKDAFIPGETVILTGAGFTPATRYELPISRPDETTTKGDGSGDPGWDTVSTDAKGAFTYPYLLAGPLGPYIVQVYPEGAGPGSGGTPLANLSFGAVEPASLIVRLVAGLTPQEQQEVISRNGGLVTGSLPALRLYFVQVPQANISTALQRFRDDSQVLSAEPDKVREAGTGPSDPAYPDQWNLPQIGWDSLFGSVTPSGSSVLAILDTGVEATHPDLDSLVLPGFSVFEGGDPLVDPNGHGTRLAGIAAGRTDNGQGLAGVAYEGVSILPVQALGPEGTGQDSDIITGIVWATDAGADVILMAFSNPGYSPALQVAIDYAWDHNVILVAATGNDNSANVTYPAGDRAVMGISATNQSDALAPASNYGQAVFLAAPGVDIPATDLGGGLTTVEGTSAAAAQVAGAAALMRAVEPSLSNGVIVGRLARSADPAGTQEQTGNGRLNLARALADTGLASLKPAGAAPNGSGGPFVGPYVAAAAASITIVKEATPADGADFTFTIQGNSTGFISTVAGVEGKGFNGADIPAISAALNTPRDMVFDSAGNLYIADSFNHRIRKVDTAGIITTFAGNGSGGFGGDNGPATSAFLNTPAGLAFDSAGNLYIADFLNNRVRKVTPAGIINTVAGNGFLPGLLGDGGLATSARMNRPRGVAFDSAGNLYITELFGNRIRKVTPAGTITTFAGAGAFINVSLNSPNAIAFDSAGNFYIANSGNNRILKVTPGGLITTFAGDGTAGFGGDGGPATSATLNFPIGLAFDSTGDLYFADSNNNRIRKVTPGGIITTVAGDGTTAFGGDNGPATSAALNTPFGLAFDSGGNLYVADQNNHRIRRISLSLPFILDDAASDDGDSFGDTQVMTNLLPGTYALTETVPAGWSLAGATCSDGSPITAIELSEGEHVTCTFTNTKPQSTITIIKDAVPDDPQDFQFNSDFAPGSFFLDDDPDSPLPNSLSFSLPPGSYTVQEIGQAGWTPTDLICSDPDGGTGTINRDLANIDLDDGETVTCTFTNTRLSSITVLKEALPDDPEDFAFNGSFGSFSLDDDPGDATLPNSKTFTVSPGVYHVTEGPVPSDWILTSIVCPDPDHGSYISGNTAVVEIDPGENITCTFTNTRRGTIRIVKHIVPDNASGVFNFESEDFGSFSLSGDFDFEEFSVPYSATPVSYSFEEVATAGWNLTSVICDDATGDSSAVGATLTVKVTGDEFVRCIFTNDPLPTVTLDKVADPTSRPEPGGEFTFTLTFTNTSVEDVIITNLTDTQSDNTDFSDCLNLVGESLDPGEAASCVYTVIHTDANSYPNTASITIKDNEDNEVSDNDTETVTVTDIEPTVTLTKMADPTTLPEPGGEFTFTLTFSNTSVENVEVVTVTDSQSSDATDFSGCEELIGESLDPDEAVSCVYTVTHIDAGSYPNTALVTVKDDEDNEVSDSDAESITVTNVNPTVTLSKEADPTSRPEPGGEFIFTLTFSNTSVENVEVVTVTDSQSSDATDFSSCEELIGESLDPGEAVSCVYTMTYTETGVYPNTASVTVKDDEDNEASDSDAETVTVTDVTPTVTLTKVADPMTLPEPGGGFTFTLAIENTSVETVSLTSLTDSQSGKAEDFSGCTGLLGDILDPNQVVTCVYTLTHTGAGSYPNTTEVTVEDDEGNLASDEAEVSITVEDTLPTVTVTKTANPTSVSEPGGLVAFTLIVDNDSVEIVSLDSLIDTSYGNLDGQGTCAINGLIAVGGSYTCVFSATVPGNAAEVETTLVTASISDDEGNEASASDEAAVTITNIDPVINLTKTAKPVSRSEPGGVFTFTLTLSNASVEEVTLTGLTDTNLLSQDCLTLIGTSLGVNASTTCAYTTTYTKTGNHPNTAKVTVEDDEGNQDSDEAAATVTVTDVLPTVSLDKLANPLERLMPGGLFTFTLIFTNTSVETVTLTGLTDTNALSPGCLGLIGASLTPGQVVSCQYTATRTSPGLYPNTAKVTVADDEDNSASASDQATIFVSKPAIVIDTQGPAIIAAGKLVTYSYTVTNAGNVPLSKVTVTDNKCSPVSYLSGDTNNNSLLDLGESWRYRCSYSPNFNSYFPKGVLKNLATARGKYQTQQVSAQAESKLYPYYLRKKIFLYWDKANTVVYPLPDNTVFTLEVRRNNLVVGSYPLSQNKPQRLWLSEGSYTFKEINLPAGYQVGHHNVSYLTGRGYPDWTFPNAILFDLALDKSGPAAARKGSAISYSYKVTNKGPARVKPRVTDNGCSPVTYLSGDTDRDGRLDPGEIWSYKCSYKVAQSPGATLTHKATVADSQRPPSGWFLGGDWNSSNNSDTWTVKVIY